MVLIYQDKSEIASKENKDVVKKKKKFKIIKLNRSDDTIVFCSINAADSSVTNRRKIKKLPQFFLAAVKNKEKSVQKLKGRKGISSEFFDS